MKIEVIILYVCIILYLVSLLTFYFLADRFVYQSKKLNQDYSFQFNSKFEELTFKSSDGTNLHALYFPSQYEKPLGTILYFHGNRGHLQKWGKIAPDFTSRGFDLYMLDYRSYGKSEGQPQEQLLYGDAKVFFNMVQERDQTKNLIIYGRSLGSAIASNLSQHVNVNKLILETPFAQMKDVLKQYLPMSYWITKNEYTFSNIDHLENQKNPIYIFHGNKDLTVPLRSAEKLKRFTNKAEDFQLIKGANHHNIREFEQYRNMLNKLLNTSITSPTTPQAN